MDFFQQLPALSEQQVVCIAMDLASEWEGWARWADRLVSPAERERAARFRFPADAARHLVGRALVRKVLRHACGVDTIDEFQANAWGKPGIPGCGVHFSLSHAGDWVLLAICRGAALGVDVETVRETSNIESLANTLHPDECAALLALPVSERRAAFFRAWSRKEAVIKALGTGLATPLTSFCVALDTRPRDWLLTPPLAGGEAWQCVDLVVAEGYTASLALLAQGMSIVFHQPASCTVRGG